MSNPIEDLRALANLVPSYGDALRRIADELDNQHKPKAPLAIDVEPGEVLVNHANVEALGLEVIAAYLDLQSKRAEILAICGSSDRGPGLMLRANEETLYIDEARKGEATTVYFPSLNGWDVHCAELSRYTAAICFTKRRD